MSQFYRLFSTVLVFCFMFGPLGAQHDKHPIADQVKQQAKKFNKLKNTALLEKLPIQQPNRVAVKDEVSDGIFFTLQDEAIRSLLKKPTELLSLSIPIEGGKTLDLELFKANVFSEGFQVFTASNPNEAYPYTPGLYYWGVVNNDDHSLAAITIHKDEIKGLISYDGHIYNLGKLNEDTDGVHILYKEKDLKLSANLSCGTDDALHYIGNEVNGFKPNVDSALRSPSNCVNMYVEVDYDIFVGKGGVTQASDYVTDVFGQVAILYANEAIEFTVSELFVWDVVDPYTGPSTSNYLTQFRDNLNGNYNGDLAHLVGYNGGGGVAYVDVLCNSFYGVGYSAINSSFANVPTYSWTVEVVTHEIGHNLGSRHTHDCVWNGNGTAIDGCGPAAGYGNSCGGGPLPESGTIMSYCHLVGGVGIDFNLGFGPQPGDLIRNEVYNATCLSACATLTPDDAGIANINAPVGTICSTTVDPEVELFNYGSNALTSVDIQYQVDGGTVNTYNWTGNLASNGSTNVALPSVSVALGSHTFSANTSNPNGTADTNSANDANSSSFDAQSNQTYYADNDGDGYGDNGNTLVDCVQPAGYVTDNTDCNDSNPNINPGAAEICGDGIDNDCDGVSEGTAGNTTFTVNPLNHNGNGSSSTSVSFGPGDADPSFTISNLNAKINGNPNNRFIDRVTIEYVDGNGQNNTYGVYDGDQFSSVNVSILSEVQSVTVTLEDGYDGNANGTLSVNLSTVSYCLGLPPCDDSDNDGVCNDDDQCPGWDDNLLGTSCDDGDDCTIGDIYVSCQVCQGTPSPDSDGDTVCDSVDNCPDTFNPDQADSDNNGIGDACQSSCNPATDQFNPNPLVHQGAGSTSSTVTLAGNTEVNFTVQNLNAKINGNPSKRYIDQVDISYVDMGGNTQNYGTFYGDQQSSVVVDILGPVQSVTVSLSDNYDGDTGSEVIDVNMTTVTSCLGASTFEGGGSLNTIGEVDIYPNPVSQDLLIRFDQAPSAGEMTVFNILGAPVYQTSFTGQQVYRIDMNTLNLGTQALFITIQIPEQEPITKRVLYIQQ